MGQKALIVVDIQNDFMPDGALPVHDAYEVVPVANRLMQEFEIVAATQDWHPPDHQSFASEHAGKDVGQVIDLHGLEQVLWPVHCVQNSPGADFVKGLDVGQFTKIFQKGVDVEIDSYSGFFDNGRRRDTGLARWLRDQGVTDVVVCGVATDYCVKFTALDAIDEGFATTLVIDGCRGVDLNDGDVDAAIAQMAEKGIVIATSDEVLG